MSKTGISYVDEVWNPMTGCSCGCEYCYAGELHEMRRKALLAGKQVPKQYAEPFEKVQLFPERLDVPLRRRKPTVFFVNSMGDLFDPQVPDEFRDQVYAVMALCPQHTFLVLTKQAERMAMYFRDLDADRIRHAINNIDYRLGDRRGALEWPLFNAWHGVTVEDQPLADERIPHLLRVPGNRFLSIEPMLGKVDLREVCNGYFFQDPLTGHRWHDDPDGRGASDMHGETIHTVILGGGTGKTARPISPQWARDIRDQCAAAGVPFFFKQWGESIFSTDEKECHRLAFDFPKAKQAGCCGGEGVRFHIGKKQAGRLLDGQLHDDLAWRD